MRRRVRTKRSYFTPDELNAMARNSKHPKQAQKCKELLDFGWRCYGTKTMQDAMVVQMTHPEGTGGIVFPNGRLVRPKVNEKTVRWDWKDVYAAATMDGTVQYDDLERPIAN